MRILHVVPTYFPATRYGGPIVSVHGLCRALAARGHDVHVFTTNVDGSGVSDVPLDRPLDIDGVKVRYFPTGVGRRLYRSPAMRDALEREIGSFDVAHLHSVFLWPTTVAARAARKARKPYVIAPRGMLVDTLIRRRSFALKSGWIALFERRNVEGAAAIHFTAEIEDEEFIRLGLRARRAFVIPNGVDLPVAAATSSRTMGENCALVRILSLGRLSWKKGLDRLVAAMPFVQDAELIIAGNDDEGCRAALEQGARALGVADRVTFVGPIGGPGKWDLLRSCDLFAMVSTSENFGVAALEAMACGRPVVVTPGVGLAKTIARSGAGVVVDGAPETLGRAIAELIAHPDRLGVMGRAGRRIAEQAFSWSAIAAQAEAMYAQCLS